MNWPHVSCEVDKKGNIVFEVTSHKGDTDEVTRFIVYADLRKAHSLPSATFGFLLAILLHFTWV